MGKFAPVFLAFLLNSFGVTVFKDISNISCGPLVSCLIFLVSEFLLLWDLPLYPCELRKLGKIPHFIVEFLMTLFIMEYILVDFWNPLENYLITITPKVGDSIHDFLQRSGVGCKIMFCDVADFLRCDIAAIISSYMMSLFFLSCALHATRVVDFRLLSCGSSVFGRDVTMRMKKLKFKLQHYFLGTKKQIKFKDPIYEECPCPKEMCHLDEHHKSNCPTFNTNTKKKYKGCPKVSKNRKVYHPKHENTPRYVQFDSSNNSDSETEYSDTDYQFPDCIKNCHTCSRHVGKF